MRALFFGFLALLVGVATQISAAGPAEAACDCSGASTDSECRYIVTSPIQSCMVDWLDLYRLDVNNGYLENFSAEDVWIECAFQQMYGDGDSYNDMEQITFSGVDQSSSSSVYCQVRSKMHYDNDHHTEDIGYTSGSSSAMQTVLLEVTPASHSIIYAQCRIPAYGNGASALHGFRVCYNPD